MSYFGVVRTDRDGDIGDIKLFTKDVDAVKFVHQMMEDDYKNLCDILGEERVPKIHPESHLYDNLIEGNETVTYNETKYTIVPSYHVSDQPKKETNVYQTLCGLSKDERLELFGRVLSPDVFHKGLMETQFITGYVRQRLIDKDLSLFEFWPKLQIFDELFDEVDNLFLETAKSMGFSVLEEKVELFISLDPDNCEIEQKESWDEFLGNEEDEENPIRVEPAYLPTFIDGFVFGSDRNFSGESLTCEFEGYILTKRN